LTIFVGALTWLVVCIGGAFAVLHRLGDYGSVLHLLIGTAMGSFGALAHIALSAFPSFRRLTFLRRGLLTWACAYSALVAIGAMLSYPKLPPTNPADWEALAKLLVVYTGGPMLALAVLVALATSAPRRQGATSQETHPK
jgi:hypothetical protein